jgi:hypothetical protein
MEYLSSSSGLLVSERVPLARELVGGGAAQARPESPEGRFVLGHFLFEAAAFAAASAFVRSALASAERRGGLEILGLDEIGRLELDRGAGLRPCLDLALASAAAGSGPELLVCAARDANASALRDLVQAAGLPVDLASPPRAD